MHIQHRHTAVRIEVRQAEKSEPGELANLFGEIGEARCVIEMTIQIQVIHIDWLQGYTGSESLSSQAT